MRVNIHITGMSKVRYVTEHHDDGSSGEFNGENYPHSEEMRTVFRHVFGLQHFRKNQLQAVNAALLGHDTFILMPTGK